MARTRVLVQWCSALVADWRHSVIPRFGNWNEQQDEWWRENLAQTSLYVGLHELLGTGMRLCMPPANKTTSATSVTRSIARTLPVSRSCGQLTDWTVFCDWQTPFWIKRQEI